MPSDPADPAPDHDDAVPPGGRRPRVGGRGRAATGALKGLAVDTRPLRHGDFRRLFVGQGVAFVGYQVTAVAVPVQMFAITGSSFQVGLLGLAALVPLIGFGLYGGSVSDAVDRRGLLIGSSLLVFAATVALLVQAVAGAESAALLLVLTALQSVGFAVSAPVRGAIIPRLLPTELVASGNTLSFTASNVGTVAGPLLAGVVIVTSGYGAAYAVDAVLFLAGLYAAVRLPSLPPLGEIVRPGLRSVADGLRFITTRPVLLLSFVVDIIAMVLAMPRALFPEVAAERFGGESSVGYLFAAIALGSVLGGLASGWIGRVRRQGLVLVGSVVAWGALVALAGLARSLWLALLLLALAGAADLVSAVFRQTILQTSAPDEMRGRLQGVFTVVVAGGPRLGDVRAGGVAVLLGAGGSWVAGGVACVVVTLVLASFAPALVRYEVVQDQDQDGGGEPQQVA